MATPDKMGSIICNRIDFNGVGALRGQRARTQQELTQVSPSVGGGGGANDNTNSPSPTWTYVETDRELGQV